MDIPLLESGNLPGLRAAHHGAILRRRHGREAMSAFRIGDATVTRIEESYEPNFDAQRFFPDWRPEVVREHRDWLLPHHFDADKAMLKLSIHSWVVRTGKRTILIDTCIGNHKPRPMRPLWNNMNTPYLDRLAAAGVTPEQVDCVLCTHLHVDHV